MYSVHTSSWGDVDILLELDALKNLQVDFSGVTSEVTRVIQDANERDRLSGVDVDGHELIPLAKSTVKRRQGSPTPFVEHGTSSRVITNLVISVEFSSNLMSIGLSWAGMEWLDYHAQGIGRLPKRDIMGIRSNTIGLLDEIVTAEADRQVTQALKVAGRSRDKRGRFKGRSS